MANAEVDLGNSFSSTEPLLGETSFMNPAPQIEMQNFGLRPPMASTVDRLGLMEQETSFNSPNSNFQDLFEDETNVKRPNYSQASLDHQTFIGKQNIMLDEYNRNMLNFSEDYFSAPARSTPGPGSSNFPGPRPNQFNAFSKLLDQKYQPFLFLAGQGGGKSWATSSGTSQVLLPQQYPLPKGPQILGLR